MLDKQISFEELEKDIMNQILKEDNTINNILRKQYEACVIESRDFTGVGFFTKFKVDIGDDLIRSAEYDYGNIYGKINGIHVGVILFVTDRLHFLEGFTCGDDVWPEKIFNYELYLCEKQRVSESCSTFVEKPETLIRKSI